MSNGILVFAEHREGTLNKASFEAIAAAQAIGAEMQLPVSAVVLGSGVQGIAQEIAGFDLQGVILAENEKLADYTPDGYADGMERVVREQAPKYVIMPHTYLVRDFAPKLAARFEKGLISDCIRAKVEGGSITVTRRVFLG